jgi:RNA polymerase sigma factor (sigma-70 family)
VVRRGQGSGSRRGSGGRSEVSPRAFADFYERYYPQILRYFVSRVHDGHKALDLTAETFAQAYEARERFRGNSEAEAVGWLFVIARRQLNQLIRHDRVETAAFQRLQFYRPSVTEDEARRVEEIVDAQASSGPLGDAFEELSAHQQRVVLLYVLDEHTHAEIAEELETSEVAVRMCLWRARRRLAANPQLRRIVEGHNYG